MEGDDVVVNNEEDELMDLPPGFRFHPTDEEIITYYLKEKVINNRFTAQAIGQVDLNKCEPWDLPKKAKMGEKEYFFFWQRDRKYPTGMRTNRATESGYWKATGKDKEIFKGKGNLVGMKKTLVFYKGRAPKGEKTNWVMHEFRLQPSFSYPNLPKSKEEWVVSKIFHKMAPKIYPTRELIRGDSILNHLLDDDSPSLPGLMKMNSADETPEYSNFTNGEEEIKDPNNSSLLPIAQYQPYYYNNNLNIKYYQAASSSNASSSPNPIFYPHQNTYQNLEFAYHQNKEIRPGFIQSSNQAFYQAAIREDCKMEQFSTNNNSMVSHSQDTGLSTDVGHPEISSVVSKPEDNIDPGKSFEDLEYFSSGPNIAELDSFWDY